MDWGQHISEISSKATKVSKGAKITPDPGYQW